jgi:uncharacterized protein (TIGR01244 family)
MNQLTNMMNKQLYGLLLLLSVALSGCRTAAPTANVTDLSSIRNFLRVNESFCTGGQPTMEHLAQLKAEGTKAIFNLRVPSEHNAAEEEAKARALGLKYFSLPVSAASPQPQQVDEFLKLTDDPANRPAFVHCAGALRVGAFWMIRRVLRDGWTVEKAAEEAEKIGLRGNAGLKEFALQYVKEHAAKAP